MSTTPLSLFELNNKSVLMKKEIIRFYIDNGSGTITELAKELSLSVPTTTKLIGELIINGFVKDFGKQETLGGRRPNLYGLNPDSGYFIGVDIKYSEINIALLNFKGEVVKYKNGISFKLSNTPEALERLCVVVEDFIAADADFSERILCVGLSMTGRVNTNSGFSYSYFHFEEMPLDEYLKERLGIRCFVDNDSRTMAYGEYKCGVAKGEKDVIFVNLSWGVGIGIIINGNLYYGKSGFAGEFGHVSTFKNEILCSCGKKGCLETEASGLAIHRIFNERIREGSTSILQKKEMEDRVFSLAEIIAAALREDVLAIDIIEEVGNKIGRAISGLMNIFNPELLIIGGTVSKTDDYILFPTISAIKKNSLNLVNSDTAVKLSKLGQKAGVIGAGLLAREHMLA